MPLRLIMPILFMQLCILHSNAQNNYHVELSSLFGDNMVLQRSAIIPIWGKGIPGENLSIYTEWDSKIQNLKVSEDSLWKAFINTSEAGGPYRIEVKGSDSVIINNVMIGDVWLCSGQSNMEWTPYSNNKNGIPNLEVELLDANNYPNLRFFSVKRAESTNLEETCQGSWRVSDSLSSRWFSAVGQFFGRTLCDNLDIPIGLIGSYWGGTGAEVWTPYESVYNDEEIYKASKCQIQDPRWYWPIRPGAVYNAMIHPLVNFPISGVIWYQGESNVKTWWTYSKLMQIMVSEWREAWRINFPFYIVQISPYFDKEGKKGSNVKLRNEQVVASKTIQRSGIVTISDVGDSISIHPANKRPVGERLAWLALYDYYMNDDYKDLLSPLYDYCERQGNKVFVHFKNSGLGLKTCHGEHSELFEVSGPDGIWYNAEAQIENDCVIVESENVSDPVRIRYAWESLCFPDIINSAGIPVSAFNENVL